MLPAKQHPMLPRPKPPEFRSAISKAIGLDQSLYHGEVIRNGYRMQNRGWGERQSSPAGGYASAVVGQGGPYGLKDTGTVMTSEGQRQLRPMSSPTAWSIGATDVVLALYNNSALLLQCRFWRFPQRVGVKQDPGNRSCGRAFQNKSRHSLEETRSEKTAAFPKTNAAQAGALRRKTESYMARFSSSASGLAIPRKM
jgi:hypothetical protein